MTDFLNLFEPVLVKLRAYGEKLKQSISDSEAFLRSLVEIIEAGKTVEGSSATLHELEKDADEAQYELSTSSETLNKIENLLKRTKRYANQEITAKPPVPLPPTIRNPRPEIRYETSTSYADRSVEPTRKISAFVPSADPPSRVASQVEQPRPYNYSGSEAESGPTLSLTEETRNRIEDLFSGKGFSDGAVSSASPSGTLGDQARTTTRVANPEVRKLRPFVWAPARSSSDESS